MSNDVWVGALLSIPIGVATSLATPSIQKWLEGQSRQRVLLKTRRVESEYSDTAYFHRHQTLFIQYMIQIAIKTTMISAAMAVVAGMLFMAGQIGARSIFFAAGQFASLVGSVLIINVCRPALTLWTRIRNFTEYAATIPDDIKERVDKQLCPPTSPENVTQEHLRDWVSDKKTLKRG